MKDLVYLNKFFWRYRLLFFSGIIFVAVSNVFGVLPPQVIRHALDLVKDHIALYRLLDGFDLQPFFYKVFGQTLMFFGVAVLTLAILKGAFMFFMRQTLIVMSRHIEYDLKNELYAHYQKLDIAFYKRNNTGDLMSRIAEDVSRVRMYIGPGLMYAINLIALFAMVIYTMIQVNAELTFYVLLPLPALSLSIYFINNIINRKSEEIQRQLSRLTSVAQEVYSGIRVIKSYVQEKQALDHFDAESRFYKEKSLSLARIDAFFSPLMMLLIGLSTILTVYIGGLQVVQGKVTTGNIAEFVIYVNMLTWPVTAIGWVASIIQRAAASQKRINEFLFTEPAIASLTGARPEIQGAVTFENVSFTYPDTGIEALREVSFHLEPGQKMAIVGKTGSGKTTIADLLVRLYEPTTGKIKVDLQLLSQIDLPWLRQKIGFVPQDVFLFSDTIARNISFGESDENLEKIKEAARFASILKEIEELPKDFETVVGERGVTLSGGQKQRVSIARALIKSPAILLLDDCLSAVDAHTEKEILGNLSRYLKDKTAIIITHRIFTLIDFDLIVVMEDGRIIEQGKHAELIENKGAYYRLFQKQKTEEKKLAG